MFWQAPPTGLLFILLPLIHPDDLRPDAGTALALYYTLAGLVVLSNLGIILGYRAAEKNFPAMASKEKRAAVRLDVLGLFLAGLINTFLALLDAGIILGPGTVARQPDLLLRAAWIAEHTLRWQGGWLFWFAVTLSFCLELITPLAVIWTLLARGAALAIGVALIAAAVDIVGVLVNLTVLPELAHALTSTLAGPDPVLQVVFHSMESLANALTNVAAFGLYSFAGLLLLPAVFATPGYPRWLAWLGAAEWGIAALATVLLVFAPGLATGPLLVSFALYAPWVWGSAVWLLRSKPVN